MVSTRTERRLAAILAADVVGYSRLVEQDEAGTLAAIRDIRHEVIDPLLAEHRGRIVKLMGDGALAEFGSVVDAVACAVAVQAGRGPAGAGGPRAADRVPDRHQPRRRGGRGRGPARRRRQRRRPAGAALRARRRAGLGHRLRPPQGQARPAARLCGRAARQEHPAAGPGLSRGLAGGHGVGCGASGTRADGGPSRPLLAAVRSWRVASGGSGRSSRPAAKPSIAVLPFDNLGGDEATGRLADGVTEDIITDLARYRDLDVIARNSTGGLRGQAGRRPRGRQAIWTSRYVLEGSIQRQGDQVRVTAQLIDAGRGTHVWSERWDRPAADVFAVQTEIAEQVANRLAASSGAISGSRTSGKPARATGGSEGLRPLQVGSGSDDALHQAKSTRRLSTGSSKRWTKIRNSPAPGSHWPPPTTRR